LSSDLDSFVAPASLVSVRVSTLTKFFVSVA
jgi:hypothetical protein